jgi:large conductance mechanosensitive channel protein
MPKTTKTTTKPKAAAQTITRQAETSRGTETIRVQVPKGMPKSHISVLVNHELAEPVHGFFQFLRERAIVGLAVGFMIGQQSQALIKQLVDSFITPVLSLVVGSELQAREFHIGAQAFTWGKFSYVFINFLFVILAIYVVIKLFKLDRLDKPKDKDKDKSKDAKADKAAAPAKKK